jgi:hypothetical protein
MNGLEHVRHSRARFKIPVFKIDSKTSSIYRLWNVQKYSNNNNNNTFHQEKLHFANAIVARGKKRNIYPCLAHVTSNNYELINTSVYYYHNRLINHRRTSKGCHRLLIQNFIFFLRTLHQSANFCFRGWFSRMINSRSELHARHIAFVCKSFLEWGARVYW